jgi:SulP family sulfate permease
VVFDLVVAIEVGIVLAALLFLVRMSEVTEVKSWKYVGDNIDEKNDPMALRFKVVPKNTMVYEITGPMFFAAADKFLDINIAPGVKVLVLRMRGVPAMDVTALRSLRKIHANCTKRGITLLLSHVNEQPFTMMAKAGFVAEVGEDNFCENIDAALEKAATIK